MKDFKKYLRDIKIKCNKYSQYETWEDSIINFIYDHSVISTVLLIIFMIIFIVCLIKNGYNNIINIF